MKLLSDIYEKLVKESFFENDATKVYGIKGYNVMTMCTTNEDDEPKKKEWAVQAGSEGEAKKAAMIMSKEAGYKSCKIVGVDFIPNSEEELNDYGSGKDMNSDPDAMKGQVKPSDVSSGLPNLDA
jgi:hypothetical protein